jgi:outer membrane protein insertion porin family
MANVYGYNLPADQQGTNSGPMRFSTGLSVDWRSPMGPLTFSLATPLNEQPGDVSNPFQFSVTSTL